MLSIRKPMIETLIKKLTSNPSLKVNYEYINDFDPDTISNDLIKDNVVLSKDEKNPKFDKYLKNMHIKNVSNNFKHFKALKKGLEDSSTGSSKDITSYDYVMIIEDDVLFGDDIDNTLVHVLKEAVNGNVEWDVLFLGQPTKNDQLITSKNPTIKFNDSFDNFEVFPVIDSYIVKKDSLKKIVDNYLPIRYVTNIQLASVMQLNNVNVKSVWPNLFLDGSKFGVYISSLEINNRLFLNPAYNSILLKLVYENSQSSADEIEKEIKDFKFQDHPDFKYLTGLFEIKKNNYQKAKTLFEDCYKIYEANNNPLNGESEFLFNYINIFKHFQLV